MSAHQLQPNRLNCNTLHKFCAYVVGNFHRYR
nr:MAG TPA: hypothetical protein [Caudoviricetes sp.]